MSYQQQIMPLDNGQGSRRDVEQCKIAFVGIISQVLYARRGFASTCFQLVKTGCRYESLEDILSGRRGIARFNIQHLDDPGVIVYLRRAPNAGVASFLEILETDILPLIGTGDLAEFRLNFQEPAAWGSNELKEYFNVVCKDHPDGKIDLHVWRAGVGPQSSKRESSGLLNLGIYLSRLQEWKGFVHWSLSMRPKAALHAPVVGLWIYNVTESEEDNLGLRQKRNYCLERAARLCIEPLPPKSPIIPTLSPSGYSHAPLSDVSYEFQTIDGLESMFDLEPVENTLGTQDPQVTEEAQANNDSEPTQVSVLHHSSKKVLDPRPSKYGRAIREPEAIYDLDGDCSLENSSVPECLPDIGPGAESEVSVGYAPKRTSKWEDNSEVESRVNKKQKITHGFNTKTSSQAKPNSEAKVGTQTKTLGANTRTSQMKGTITTNAVHRFQPKPQAKTKSQQAEPGVRAGRKTDPEPNSQAKAETKVKKPPLPSERQLPAQSTVSNVGKTIRSKTSQRLVPANNSTKIMIAKRKPKRPAQILEDTAPLPPPIQVNPRRKTPNFEAQPQNHRQLQKAKKHEQPTTKPAMRGARKLLGRMGGSSDPVVRPRSSSLEDLPQLPPNQDSSQLPVGGSGPKDWFTASDLSSDPLHQGALQASPPDAGMASASNENEDGTTFEPNQEEDVAEFSHAISFAFSPNTVRRRISLIDDLPASDGIRAANES